MKGMETGWTLFYGNGEMNLNYFSYQKRTCIRGIVDAHGESWEKLRRNGFTVRKIKAKEAL